MQYAPECISTGLGVVKIIGLPCTLHTPAGNRPAPPLAGGGGSAEGCGGPPASPGRLVGRSCYQAPNEPGSATLNEVFKLASLVRLGTLLLFPSLKLTA